MCGFVLFWFILQCVRVEVVVIGGARLRWWWLAVLSCDGGSVCGGGSVCSGWSLCGWRCWVISCRDYGLKRESREERECEGREKNIKIIYRKLL